MQLSFLLIIIFSIGIVVLLWVDQLRHKRLLISILFLAYLLFTIGSTIRKDIDVNFNYKETVCTITSSMVTTVQYSRSTIYYPTFNATYTVNESNYNNDVRLNVTDYGMLAYQSAYVTTQQYPVGQQFICWYNPKDPNFVVLEKGWYTGVSDWKFAFMAGMIFVVMLLVVVFDLS